MWLRFKLFVLITLIWNSLPPSIVDFKSLSSFKGTINITNVNLFTRYWCSVWFYNLHCKLVYLYSMCMFCIVKMRCVSGPRPFITNKFLKHGAVELVFPDFTRCWCARQRLAAVHLDWVLIVVGVPFLLEAHHGPSCFGAPRAAASSECRISIKQTSPIPSSSRRLANLSHDAKVFATDEIIQKHRRAPYLIHVAKMFRNYQIRK